MRSKSKVPSKVRHYQPRLEELEPRLAPAGFATLATDLNNALTAPLNSVLQFANQEQAALPIIGQSLQALASSVGKNPSEIANAMTGLASNVQNALNKNLAPNASEAQFIQQMVNNGFNNLTDAQFDPAHGNFQFTANFDKSFGVTSENFNLGLPGVPMSLTTQVGVNIDVNFGAVTVKLQNGAFSFQSGNTLAVTVNADVTDLSFTGYLGFFKVSLSNPDGVTAPVHLSAGLTMSNNNGVLSNPALTGGANIDIHLAGFLAPSTSDSAVSTFPHIETDFVMSWPLIGNSSVGSASGLGSTPTVEFDNIKLGMGSFLGSMMQPLANAIDEITAPLAPVYAMMEAPLPGLSNLATAVGLQPVTLDTILAVAVNSDLFPPDYQLLAQLGLRLHTLVEIIRNTTFDPNNDPLIPMGSFNLSGANTDLRTTLLDNNHSFSDWLQNPSDFGNLTSLIPVAVNGLSSVEDRIKNDIGSLGLPGALQNQVTQAFNQIDTTLLDAQNGFGLTFPLLDDPSSIYKLLLGQDVDFVHVHADFNGQASETQTFPIWGPITAGFTGAIKVSMNLDAGVDTYGIRQYFINAIKTGDFGDVGLLTKSFYVVADSAKPLVSLDGSISAMAGPKITFGVPDGPDVFAEATFTGQIKTDQPLTVSFINSIPGGQKLRPIGMGGPLFVVHNTISAKFGFAVSAGVEVAGNVFGEKTVFSVNLGQTTIYDTSKFVTANPLNQPPPPAYHSIDVIFDARLFNDIPFTDDMYVEVDNDDNLNIIYNGVVRATYAQDTVRSVTVFGSDEDTLFFVSGNFDNEVPVQIVGGKGSNDMFFDDSAFTFDNIGTPTYSIHDGQLERGVFVPGVNGLLDLLEITYQNMQLVNVDAAINRPDTVNVYDLSGPTTIVGGNQGNVFSLGGPNGSLNSVFGDLHIVGGTGFDQLLIDDETTDENTSGAKTPGPTAYSIGHDGLDRTQISTFTSPFIPSGRQIYDSFTQHLDYSSIDWLQIDGGSGGNTFTVDDVPSANDVNPTAMIVDLDTGTGNDNVTAAATTGPLFIHGQGGADVVTLGVPQLGTADISSRVFIDNSNSALRQHATTLGTTLNINDADDSTQRTVTFDTPVVGLGTIDGFVGTHTFSNPFAPVGSNNTTVEYAISDMVSVNVQGGNDFNTFNVLNTPADPSLLGGRTSNHVSTHLTLGNFFSTVNVSGTTGPLTITGGGGLDDVFLGGESTSPGELGNLHGQVVLDGGFSTVAIKDGADHGFRYYTMNADSFTGGSGGGILYSDLTATTVSVSLANDGNQVTINGTPTTVSSGFGQSGVSLFTGNGSDFVQVNGSTSPLHIDLGAGAFQNVSIGSNKASLDGIGDVSAYGSGTIQSFISDAAAATGQTFNLTTIPGAPNSQVVTRLRPTGDGSYTLNTFTFDFDNDELQLTAGKGGDEFYILGTPANTTTLIQSGAGQDSVNINTDVLIPKVLGPVYFYGNAAQGDNASFVSYDSATPPQFYILQATASKPISRPNVLDQQVVLLSGDAPITFKTIAALTVNMPNVGGNFVSIQGVPAGEALTVNDSNDDRVIFGNAISSPIGLMTDILGTTTINANTNSTITLDDSIDSTGRHVVLQNAAAGGDLITGMSPGDIHLGFGEGTSVNLLGGLGNDTFSLAATAFYGYHIDGGKGTNTLDYSKLTTLESQSGVDVNLQSGEASGLFGISRIQNVIGSPFDDVLVGNGGNVLDGGGGHDLLIAGATASTLEGGGDDDILIGGTTAYDGDIGQLDAVLAEWISNHDAPMLNGQVTSNGGGNTLLGQAGSDLFFMGNGDSNKTDINKEDLVVYA